MSGAAGHPPDVTRQILLASAEQDLDAARAHLGDALTVNVPSVHALTALAGAAIAIADELAGINARLARADHRAESALTNVRALERWLEETPEDEQVCEGCGCSSERACVGGCYWIAPGRCSSCDRRGAGAAAPPLVQVVRP